MGALILLPGVASAGPEPFPTWIETERILNAHVVLACPGSHDGLPLGCRIESHDGNLSVQGGAFLLDGFRESVLVRMLTEHDVPLPLFGDGLCEPDCWPRLPRGAPVPTNTYVLETGDRAYARPHSTFPFHGNATLSVDRVGFNVSRGIVPEITLTMPGAVAIGNDGRGRLPVIITYRSEGAPYDVAPVTLAARLDGVAHPVDLAFEGDPVRRVRLDENATMATTNATILVRAHTASPPGWLANVTVSAYAPATKWRFAANGSASVSVISPMRVAVEARRADRDVILDGSEVSVVLWVQNRGNAVVNVTGRLLSAPEGFDAEFTTPRTLLAPRFPNDNRAGSAVEFLLRAEDPPEKGVFTLVIEGSGVDFVAEDAAQLVVPFVISKPAVSKRVDLGRASSDATLRQKEAEEVPAPGAFLVLVVGLGVATVLRRRSIAAAV